MAYRWYSSGDGFIVFSQNSPSLRGLIEFYVEEHSSSNYTNVSVSMYINSIWNYYSKVFAANTWLTLRQNGSGPLGTAWLGNDVKFNHEAVGGQGTSTLILSNAWSVYHNGAGDASVDASGNMDFRHYDYADLNQLLIPYTSFWVNLPHYQREPGAPRNVRCSQYYAGAGESITITWDRETTGAANAYRLCREQYDPVTDTWPWNYLGDVPASQNSYKYDFWEADMRLGTRFRFSVQSLNQNAGFSSGWAYAEPVYQKSFLAINDPRGTIGDAWKRQFDSLVKNNDYIYHDTMVWNGTKWTPAV